MAKTDSKNGGICRLYTADTHSHIIFAATYQLKIDHPERELTEIVAHVTRTFGLDISVDTALRRYYILLNAYLENGGA